MTYNVFGGTLNFAQLACAWVMTVACLGLNVTVTGHYAVGVNSSEDSSNAERV